MSFYEESRPLSRPTDGEAQTSNNYDCQNFQQVFSGVSVHIKHVFSGVPNISRSFQLSKRSPRHSKENPGKLDNLEIQIFEV